MSYSAINTNKAVTSSRKKNAAVTEEEPLPFDDGDTEDKTPLYGEEEEY